MTLALVAAGAAAGWIGTRTLRHANDAPRVVAGDFSAILAAAQRPVVLFATSTCPFCRRARDLLDATHVDYRLYEIDTSDSAKALYRTLEVEQVPVLVTRDARVVGFNDSLYRLRTRGLAAAN